MSVPYLVVRKGEAYTLRACYNLYGGCESDSTDRQAPIVPYRGQYAICSSTLLSVRRDAGSEAS